MSEIAISARPVVDSVGKAIRVTIAGADLDLIPQNPAASQSKPGETPQPVAATAPGHSVWSGKFDIFLVQRAEDGMQAHVTGQTVGLHLKPATYHHAVRTGSHSTNACQPKPGTGSLRVVVVDVNSGPHGFGDRADGGIYRGLGGHAKELTEMPELNREAMPRPNA